MLSGIMAVLVPGLLLHVASDLGFEQCGTFYHYRRLLLVPPSDRDISRQEHCHEPLRRAVAPLFVGDLIIRQ